MTQVRRLMMGIGLSSLVLPSVLGVRLAGRSSHADSAWRLADGARRTAACEPLHGAWEPSRCAACRVAPPDRQGAGGTLTADLDDDDRSETYAAARHRLVRRDAPGGITWESPPITRGFSLVAFDDLDGDGRREPLMLGTGLNSSSPLLLHSRSPYAAASVGRRS